MVEVQDEGFGDTRFGSGSSNPHIGFLVKYHDVAVELFENKKAAKATGTQSAQVSNQTPVTITPKAPLETPMTLSQMEKAMAAVNAPDEATAAKIWAEMRKKRRNSPLLDVRGLLKRS